ncbi:uncharacterized protein MELLADRAFT_117302 [Melampsora larici-populina 98AG31]|uniref:Uncharacterized protein n=1 Tax=Melampsora larici-populina (strain 98AG31 / pathotype 3-4-7) TaxID=747676 RepID=F4RVP7_MELLP|nr:uncharacterized protein MELLADRAFT_117302 [Melampsora larici-populina 98AG31]EGG03395.1 hypothetical protein MELLADRAFT_117302 [Melampsora larici-populina 98AG31]
MSSITFIASMESSAQLSKTQPQPKPVFALPIIPVKANEPYYHESYPITTPGVDLILASSDLISCRFAISSRKLAFQPEVFSRTDRVNIELSLGVPLVQMDGSKEVVEIILSCLDSNLIPDLSAYKFDDLVSALEAVAGGLELEKVERLCLLAIGSYYKSKPVHVFALAEIYECDWMAKLASEETLPLDITLSEHKRLLSSEAYDALLELHSYRRKEARRILSNLRIPLSFSHPSNCEPSHIENFWKSSLGRLKRAALNSSADLNMKRLFSPELEKAASLLPCSSCRQLVSCFAELAAIEFSQVRRWVLPTSSNFSDSSLPTHEASFKQL